MDRKKFTPIIILVVVGILAIGGGIWYYKVQQSSISRPSLGKPSNQKLPPEKQAVEDQYAKERAEGLKHPAPKVPFVVATTSIVVKDVAGWETYRDELYGYEITLPKLAGIDVSRQTKYDTSLTSLKSLEGTIEMKIGDRYWYRKPRGQYYEACSLTFLTKLNNDSNLEIDFSNSNFSSIGCTPISLSENITREIFSSLLTFDPLSDWKSYHYEKYGIGISFKYPPNAKLSVTNDGLLEIIYPPQDAWPISIRSAPPSTEFRASVSALGDVGGKYVFNYDTNQWLLEGKPTCAPSLHVGAAHAPTEIYVLKQGFLEVGEGVEPPLSHTDLFYTILKTLTFDHPEAIVQPRCPDPDPYSEKNYHP